MATPIPSTSVIPSVELVAPGKGAPANASKNSSGFKSELNNASAKGQSHELSEKQSKASSLKSKENSGSHSEDVVFGKKGNDDTSSSSSISAQDTNISRSEKNIQEVESLDDGNANLDKAYVNKGSNKGSNEVVQSVDGKQLPDNGDNLPQQTVNSGKSVSELESEIAQAAQLNLEVKNVNATTEQVLAQSDIKEVEGKSALANAPLTVDNEKRVVLPVQSTESVKNELADKPETTQQQAKVDEKAMGTILNSTKGSSGQPLVPEVTLQAAAQPAIDKTSVLANESVKQNALNENIANNLVPKSQSDSVQNPEVFNGKNNPSEIASQVGVDTKATGTASVKPLVNEDQKAQAAPVVSDDQKAKAALSGANAIPFANKDAAASIEKTLDVSARQGKEFIESQNVTNDGTKLDAKDNAKVAAPIVIDSKLSEPIKKIEVPKLDVPELEVTKQEIPRLQGEAVAGRLNVEDKIVPQAVGITDTGSARVNNAAEIVNINALDKSLATNKPLANGFNDQTSGQKPAATLVPPPPVVQPAVSSSVSFDNSTNALNQSLDKMRSGIDSSIVNISSGADDTGQSTQANTKVISSSDVAQQLTNLQSSLRTSTPVQLQMPPGTPPSDKNWGKAVADKVMISASQNLRVANIQLDPPELGALQVRLQVTGVDQQMSVSFSSPHASVRDALEQQLPRLREMLEEQGINLGESSVKDQGRDNEGGSNNENFSNSAGYAEQEDGAPINPMNTQGTLALVDFYA